MLYAHGGLVLLLHASLALGAINLRAPFARLAGLDDHPKRQTETCYGTCVTCFGVGYRTCVGNYCFNPDLGQTCCSTGEYCDPGYYCTSGGCCPNGENCGYSQVGTLSGSVQASSASSYVGQSSSNSPPGSSSNYISSPAISSSYSSYLVPGPGQQSSSPRYGYSSTSSTYQFSTPASTSPRNAPGPGRPTPAQSSTTGGFGIQPASSSSASVAPGGAAGIHRGSLADLIVGAITWLLLMA